MKIKINAEHILLINDLIPHSGIFNMEFDNWMYLLSKEQDINPVFRVYEWERSVITYGKFQKLDEFNLELCKKDGVEVVKRPTGGRAILHNNEITFSLALKSSHIKPYSFRAIFVFIAENIASALSALGISAKINLAPTHYESSASCFNSLSQYEIVDKYNNKLAGIAQYFTAKAALIQGSIPLQDNSGIKKYLIKDVKIERFENELILSGCRKSELRKVIISNFSVPLRSIFGDGAILY